MKCPSWFLFIAMLATLLMSSCAHDYALPEDPIDNGLPCDSNVVYFPLDVLPILEANCAFGGCHDAGTKEEGVQLDTYVNTVTTGKVKPGKPQKSELFKEIENGNMPPSPYAPLDAAQVSIIEKWILQGAKNLSCTTDGSCNTTDVSFATTVSPILQTRCLSCHAAAVYVAVGGGIDLSSYNAVKLQALNGRLYGSISHDPNYKPMPQGVSQLPLCNINQIKSWIDAGAPNN